MLQIAKPTQADKRHFPPNLKANRKLVAAKCAALSDELKAFEDGQFDHDLATALDRHIERFGLRATSAFSTAYIIERASK